MRMKQNGVTTIVIVVIVIVIVAIAGVGAYLATKEGEGEAALGITTTSLSDGVVGVAYSATLVASGGTSPYTWENIGSLPDGLSLSTGGTISGNPTTEGDFSFTVKVTDSVENTDTKALSIHVGAAGGEYTGTGTENYSGTWSGTGVSGTWEFAVDWGAGTVSGWFTGDAAGNVTGSVSPGAISASGSAAWGLVSWSGTFSADGSSVSGTWSAPAIYSGTFSGTKST